VQLTENMRNQIHVLDKHEFAVEITIRIQWIVCVVIQCNYWRNGYIIYCLYTSVGFGIDEYMHSRVIKMIYIANQLWSREYLTCHQDFATSKNAKR